MGRSRLLLQLKRLCRDRRGNVALLFSLAIVPLIALGGAGFDLATISTLKSQMQAAADAGAMRAARELRLARAGAYDLTPIARPAALNILGATANAMRDVNVQTALIDSNTAVKVSVSGVYDPKVIRVINKDPIVLKATAVARTAGFPICALALDETVLGVATLYLESSAQVTAQYCAIQSNSKSPVGITALQSAKVTAGQICSAGGTFGPRARFQPQALNDCPIVSDPLASRAPPSVSGCTHNDEVIDGGTLTLSPGVFCGGLKITHGATVTFAPGEYVIKDGEFIVDGGATINAQSAGFYLTGDDATIKFASDSNIRMTAPLTGPLAGILFFEDHAAQPYRVHKFTSDNAPVLLGTIYLPQGQLVVDANHPVAEQSAFTIIIAKRIALMAGPNLVLNSDYGSTNVPVPGGLNPGRTYLVQ